MSHVQFVSFTSKNVGEIVSLTTGHLVSPIKLTFYLAYTRMRIRVSIPNKTSFNITSQTQNQINKMTSKNTLRSDVSERWWAELEDDLSDPISMHAICELPYPPFVVESAGSS